MVLTVKEIINETEDAVSVVLKKPGFFNRIKYKAGQFLTVKIPIKGSIEKRAYSFSSSPYVDDFLRITVKKVQEGLVSNYICDSLKAGQKIEIEKPTGSFFVVPDKKAQNNYVFFAGGSGITPIFSIVKTVLEKEPLSNILLIYSNRNEESIIFKKAIEDIAQKYPGKFSVEHLLEKKEVSKDNYHQSLLNDELVDIILKKHNISYLEGKYMMCGPQGFMDKAKEILYAQGITRDKIKLEAFKASAIRFIAEKDKISNVSIKFEGKEQIIGVAGDKTILQAAMANGIMLPYSCRSGMCSTCKAKCTSGEIKMIDGHLLSDAEVANGNVLTCVSFPASEEIRLDFETN